MSMWVLVITTTWFTNTVLYPDSETCYEALDNMKVPGSTIVYCRPRKANGRF